MLWIFGLNPSVFCEGWENGVLDLSTGQETDTIMKGLFLESIYNLYE